MYQRTDLIYQYDGSWEGFLCCVFRAVYQREQPLEIWPEDAPQATLLEVVAIPTETDKAARVRRSIPEKLGPRAEHVLKLAFLAQLEDRELALLAFLRLGYRTGPAVMRMMADERVHKILAAAQQVANEAHLYKGFTRFSQYGGCLAAEIQPKNCVLPLLGPHFRARMPGESFLIYDKTHRQVLAGSGGLLQILPAEDWALPRADGREQLYRRLWTRFYDTIAIEGRYNPRCRQTNMPKRYWGLMTEFQEENRAALPPADGSR